MTNETKAAQPQAAIQAPAAYMVAMNDDRVLGLYVEKLDADSTARCYGNATKIVPLYSAAPAIQAQPLTDAARLDCVYQMAMVEPFIAPVASKEAWLASLDREVAKRQAAAKLTKDTQ